MFTPANRDRVRDLETTLEVRKQLVHLASQGLRCSLSSRRPTHADPGNKLREGSATRSLEELATLIGLLPARGRLLPLADQVTLGKRSCRAARACQGGLEAMVAVVHSETWRTVL